MQLTPVEDESPQQAVVPSAPLKLTPVDEPALGEEAPALKLTEVGPAPVEKANSFWRGAVTGAMEQNPELTAEALEGASHLAPEWFKGPLRSGSQYLRDLPKAGPEYALTAPRFRDIGSVGDAVEWMGESLGGGIASSLPSLVTGVAGGLAGGAVAGPPGAIVGTAVGGVAGGLPLNYGEVYRELKREGLPQDVSAKYASYAAPVMSALDAYSVGKLAQQFGFGEVKRQAARVMARRIAEETAKGSGREGITEGLQEVVKQMTLSLGADKPFWSMDNLHDVIENTAAGALTGGVMSAPSGIRQDRVPTKPADPSVVQQVHDEIGGAKVSSPGAVPESPTSAAISEPAPAVSGRAPDTSAEGGATLVRSSASAASEQAPLPAAAPVSEPPGPVFYSQVKRIVEEKLPDTFDAQQGLNTIRNSQGVKPEEMEWLRIPEALKEGGKVKKSDLLAHIEEHMLALEDVTYQSAKPVPKATLTEGPVEELEFRSSSDANRALRAWRSPEAPGYDIVELAPYSTLEGPEFILRRGGDVIDFGVSLEEIQRILQERRREQGTTQYEGYQAVKGGTNYREGVMKMPDPDLTEWEARRDAAIKAFDDYFNSVQAKYGGNSYGRETIEEAEELRRLDAAVTEANQQRETFQSPHWSKAGQWGEQLMNVLSHFRLSDFTDTEGKNGVMVLEIQDDWASMLRAFEKLKTYYKADKLTSYEIDDAISDRVISRQAGYMLQRYINMDGFLEPPQNRPFKTTSSWVELTMKRLFREAADNGYQRLYFPRGETHVKMYGQSDDNAAGMIEFYDKMVPKTADKLAKRYGGKTGRAEVVNGYSVSGVGITHPYSFTTLEEAQAFIKTILGGASGVQLAPISEPVFYVEMAPTMMTNVRRGLPMFAQQDAQAVLGTTDLGTPITAFPSGKTHEHVVGLATADGTPALPVAQKLQTIANKLADRMGINRPDIYLIDPGPTQTYGSATDFRRSSDGELFYTIELNPRALTDAAHMYAVMAHEFGHIIFGTKFKQASFQTQLRIRQEYNKYNVENELSEDQTMKGLFMRRDNFIMQTRRSTRGDEVTFDQLAPERREYWLGFEEWAAEQVARYFTMPESRAVTIVERFFKGVADALREMYQVFQLTTGRYADPNFVMKQWLDSLLSEVPTLWKIHAEAEAVSREKNASALRAIGVDDSIAEPESLLSGPMRKISSAMALQGPAGQQARASIAGVDRYSRFAKWMLSIQQLAARNPHILPLNDYKELHQLSTLERQTIADNAKVTIDAWQKLSDEQEKGLTSLIDDYMNMTYLSATEKQQGITRLPTANEFAALVAQYKLGNEAVLVFQKMQADFKGMLVKYRGLLEAEALKITDTADKAKALRDIQAQFDALDKVPYFPSMRFGNFTIEHRDAANKMVAFYTFETKRARGKAHDMLVRAHPFDKIKMNILDEDVGPLRGLPPGILDLIEKRLSLSITQKGALEVLKFELAPVQSFKHRFERKDRTPGYSMDFQRAYASYFFHGSNYFTRLKYLDQMREVVRTLSDESRAMIDGTTRKQIAHYVNDHLNYTLDPKADWSTLRALTFIWALGFSPAAALINMTQVLVGSYPYLGAKFGDVKAIAALSKAGAQLSTYYKKNTLASLPQRDMLAMSEGVKEGIITEAQASELAALSEGGALQGAVGNALHRTFMWTMEKGAFMFEMTEQWNRRVTFRAAWNLASENPNAAFVKEAVRKHQLQYDRLRSLPVNPWNAHDAAAFVTAKEVVESTQYIYGQYAQPRFMRGKARTIFIFKSFMQNTLFMLWNNPAVAARSLLMMAVLGGLMGLPGMDDLKGWLKVISTRLFGKNFDIDDWVRQFATEVLGGKIPPDLILHGTARNGFGLPAVMNMVGIPFPKVDLSKGVSMGNILPFDPWQAFGESANPERGMIDTVQKASGASFGAGFNIWKAVQDVQNDPISFQRITRALPRELQSLSRSWQALQTGQISDRTGKPVVKFDPRDPAHMAEIVGMALGFNPRRMSAEWDYRIAKAEATGYWEIRRQMLTRQYSAAVFANDEKNRDNVMSSIQQFNAMLPDTAKGMAISSDTLRRSIQTRTRARALAEEGLSQQKSRWPIEQEMQRLHPEADVNVRRVR